MSAHTPGPLGWWTSNSWRRLRSNPADGRDVGVVVPFVARDGHPDLEVSAADRSLIAAAPDLLALAKQYAGECSECGGTGVLHDNSYVYPGQQAGGPCPDCADIRAEYRSLEQLAGELTPAQWERARLHATLNILAELPWRETHALARLLWGDDLFAVWTIDREFLDLFRKAELVHLAGVHGCALPEGRRSWDAMKGDEIKDALLAQHEKLLRPAILADLYQGEIEEPFRPWRPGDEDDDDLPDFGPDDDMEDAA